MFAILFDQILEIVIIKFIIRIILSNTSFALIKLVEVSNILPLSKLPILAYKVLINKEVINLLIFILSRTLPEFLYKRDLSLFLMKSI